MLFFILFLSFCLRVIRKGLRKNSEIFVNLRRSSGQSMRERSDSWPEFLVFKSVPGCIEGIPGHYGMLGVLWDVPGMFRGCARLFRAVPGVFRVLQTPNLLKRSKNTRPSMGYAILQISRIQGALTKPGTWNIPEHPGIFRNIPEHPGTSRNRASYHKIN